MHRQRRLHAGWSHPEAIAVACHANHSIYLSVMQLRFPLKLSSSNFVAEGHNSDVKGRIRSVD
jgi:hypothetical protein